MRVLLFYWKESDDEGELFQYHKYGNYQHPNGETYGDIINPSFALLAINNETTDYVASGLTYGTGTVMDTVHNDFLSDLTVGKKYIVRNKNN